MSKKTKVKNKRDGLKKRAGAVNVPSKELEKTIAGIIADVAEVSKKKIGPDTDFVKDLGIDSMMAIEILAAIETKYRIEIPEEALPKMTNMREVAKLTARLLE